jgi:hypothetical protein
VPAYAEPARLRHALGADAAGEVEHAPIAERRGERAQVEGTAVMREGVALASGTFRLLEHDDVLVTALRQIPRGGQAGCAAADDTNSLSARHHSPHSTPS